MTPLKGHSLLPDGAEAVAEATAEWSAEACSAVNFLLVYHSSRQSAEQVAEALREKFPETPMAGCTTAGEFLDGARYEGGLVLFGFNSEKLQWQVGVVADVLQFQPLDARRILTELTESAGVALAELDPQRHFVMLLQDGLAMREEYLSATFAAELHREQGGVQLLGGSAGDDLQFTQTWQIANGYAYSGAAVVVLCSSEIPFQVFKHQHYAPAEEDFVVTGADPAKRCIKTLNGFPAAEEFARAIGTTVDQLDPSSYAQHPLLYQMAGERYVRSIQKVEPDHSLTLYCAIEEGVLLELAQQQSPNEVLQNTLQQVEERLGGLSLLLLFSCILCKLDLKAGQDEDRWGALVHAASPNVIGFDTYGELLNGLHINQTLVAVAFGAE